MQNPATKPKPEENRQPTPVGTTAASVASASPKSTRSDPTKYAIFPNYPFDLFAEEFEKTTGKKIVIEDEVRPDTITMEKIPLDHLAEAFTIHMELRGATVIQEDDTLRIRHRKKPKTVVDCEAPFADRLKQTLEKDRIEIDYSFEFPDDFPIYIVANEIGNFTKRAVVVGPGVLGWTTSIGSEGEFDDSTSLLQALDSVLKQSSICMREVGEHFIVFERIGEVPEEARPGKNYLRRGIVIPGNLPAQPAIKPEKPEPKKSRRRSVLLPGSTQSPSPNPPPSPEPEE